jgi:4-amino-4-deoxy-L-arabinose transferase-like glycosyltransferase
MSALPLRATSEELVWSEHPNRRWHLAASLVLSIGIGFRGFQYLRRDSLWGDEAMVALSLCLRSVGELFRPLDYGQMAPIPFLLGARLMVLVGGANEYALRSIPLLAGVALLFVMYWLATKLLSHPEALLALALAATSTVLIKYSVELKPYILDALAAAVLVSATLKILRALEAPIPWVRLGVYGVVALLISFPAPFVCAGVIASLLLAGWTDRRRDLIRGAMVLAALWVGVCGAQFLLWYRAAASTPFMRQYWASAFLTPWAPLFLRRVAAAIQSTMMTASLWAVNPFVTPFVAILTVVGGVSIVSRRGGRVGLLLFVPIFAAFLASAAGQYPVATRLLLFAVPSLVLALAAGVIQSLRLLLGRVSRRGLRAGGVFALAGFVTLSAIVALPQLRDESMREIVGRFNANARPGEAVYVFSRLVASWTFYNTDWKQPDRKRLAWTAQVAGLDGPALANPSSRGPRPPGEGLDIVYSSQQRMELLGMPSGMQWKIWSGFTPRVSDPGWSINEARRMRDAGRPCVWAVTGNFTTGPEIFELLKGVAAEGGALVSDQDALSAVGLFRVCYFR